MKTKNIHYLIAVISYLLIILNLVFGHYTHELFTSGILFFSVAYVIYAGVVYLFFKNETGKKVAMWGLIFLAMIAIFFIFKLA